MMGTRMYWERVYIGKSAYYELVYKHMCIRNACVSGTPMHQERLCIEIACELETIVYYEPLCIMNICLL
jgi:hypothetical protein